jgi:phage terminase large subunit
MQHSDTLRTSLARSLRTRAAELAPPETEADRLRRYANPPDPIGFARDVLRIKPWSKQALILAAVANGQRVSCVSGHKVGKSTALAILALWFYCSYPNARIVITATTDQQVNGIIWREIKRLLKRAKRAGINIPGADKLAIKARTGLTDPVTDSEIRGYTAKEAEAIAGVSGSYVLYLVDEASGVEDFIFQAIEGNRAGGNAWVFLISNATRAEGEFYDSHHSKSAEVLGRAGYVTIHIDSRDSPNITGEWRDLEEWDDGAQEWRKRTTMIPGLARQEWVEDKLTEWGEDHPLFKIRVAGLFSVAEEAKVFSAGLLAEMHARWAETKIPKEGRIYIGCDPAGDGDGGDESGFASRIGPKIFDLRAQAGVSPEGHIAIVQDMIAVARAAGGSRTLVPIVNVESEGEAGYRVYVAMRSHAESTGEFRVNRMRTSSKAIREPLLYDRIRDEMWACARRWARGGGALPESVKLDKDLHAPEFKSDLQGRLKVTPKKELRKILGRSPDLGDAAVMSCWEPMSARQEESAAAAAAVPSYDTAIDDMRLGGMDPYASQDPYR